MKNSKSALGEREEFEVRGKHWYGVRGYVGVAGVRTSELSDAELLAVARGVFEVSGDTFRDVYEAIKALTRKEKRERAITNAVRFGANHHGSFKVH